MSSSRVRIAIAVTSSPNIALDPLSAVKPNTVVLDLWRRASAPVDSHFYPAGIELFRQDSRAHQLYFIETGLAKVMRSEDNGREFIISLKGPGSLLGSAAAIHNKPHPFSALTVTSCRITPLPARAFLDLLAADSELAAQLHEMLSGEVLDQAAHISQLACLPARKRLELLFWQLLVEQGLATCKSEIKFQLPLRHWEAAQLLAVTPAYLSRMLSELERDGLISRKQGWIIVPDPNCFWHESGS